jgi:hypothetical protein
VHDFEGDLATLRAEHLLAWFSTFEIVPADQALVSGWQPLDSKGGALNRRAFDQHFKRLVGRLGCKMPTYTQGKLDMRHLRGSCLLHTGQNSTNDSLHCCYLVHSHAPSLIVFLL